MAALGIGTAIGLALLTQVSIEWPFERLALLATALGACAFGWNGIMLSQIATLAPPGRAADATGGMQFVMFAGVAVFPTVVALLIELSGGYTQPYLLLAALAVVGSALMWGATGRAGAARDQRL